MIITLETLAKDNVHDSINKSCQHVDLSSRNMI